MLARTVPRARRPVTRTARALALTAHVLFLVWRVVRTILLAFFLAMGPLPPPPPPPPPPPTEQIDESAQTHEEL